MIRIFYTVPFNWNIWTLAIGIRIFTGRIYNENIGSHSMMIRIYIAKYAVSWHTYTEWIHENIFIHPIVINIYVQSQSYLKYIKEAFMNQYWFTAHDNLYIFSPVLLINTYLQKYVILFQFIFKPVRTHLKIIHRNKICPERHQ